MKKILFLALFLSHSLISSAIEVVELKQSGSDKIVIKLMFRNGSASDPAGKAGLTQLTASCIVEGGTQELTSTQIADMMYPMAASVSATVDKEVSIFTFSFHKDHLTAFYDIMKGLILTPGFDKSDFVRIKSNQQNYVDEVIRTSSDEEYSKKALEHMLFRNTPYQHPVSGTSKGVESCSFEDVREHYKNAFGKSVLTVGIAGNYSDEFLSLLLNDMEQLQEGILIFQPNVQVRNPEGVEVEIIAKDGALGSAVFAGFPMNLTRANDDFAALMIANSWLGEHRKSYSRLYQKIREQRSMNYGDYTYIEWYNNGGSNMLPRPGFPRAFNYFSIWLRPVQTAKGLKSQYPELQDITIGHAHFAIRMALREMQNLITNGMNAEDFQLTKTFLRSYIKLYAQTPEQQLGFLLDSKFYGRTNWLLELDELLGKCTVEDVNRVMNQYWQTQNMYIAIVTDKSEAEPLAKSLLGNTESPMSYSKALSAVLPKSILVEDEEVKSYPMRVGKCEIIDSDKMFRE